jgi:hypothetical protein
MPGHETRFFAGEPRPRAAGFQAGNPPQSVATTPPPPTLLRRLILGTTLRLLAGLAVALFCYLRWRHWWQAWYHRLRLEPPWSLGPLYFLVNASPADDWIGYVLLAFVALCFLTFVAWPRRWSAAIAWGLAAIWTLAGYAVGENDPEIEPQYGGEALVIFGILGCFVPYLLWPRGTILPKLGAMAAGVWVLASCAAGLAHPVAALQLLAMTAAGFFLVLSANRPGQPGVTRANFARVWPGMSLEEVESLLGPPGDYTTGPPAGPDHPPGVSPTHQRLWRADEGLFWVELVQRRGKLIVRSSKFWPADAPVEPVNFPSSP